MRGLCIFNVERQELDNVFALGTQFVVAKVFAVMDEQCVRAVLNLKVSLVHRSIVLQGRGHARYEIGCISTTGHTFPPHPCFD